MPEHFRIFLASPSDVMAERHAIRELAGRLPYDPLLSGLITVHVVAWDGPYGSVPMLATRDPQAAIEYGLPAPSDCEIVVVVFFSRLGTPLPQRYWKDGGKRAVTGTEWEYEDAIEARGRDQAPEVIVYRCTRDVTFDLSQSRSAIEHAKKQLSAVDNFFERMRLTEKGYNSYEQPDDLVDHLARHLKVVIRKRLDEPKASRDRLLQFLNGDIEEVLPEELIRFAENKLEESHLRSLAIDSLLNSHFPPPAPEVKSLIQLADLLMATKEPTVGSAGVKLAARLIRLGHLPVESLKIAAMNPKYEVKSAAVARACKFEGIQVIDVFEGIGTGLSYWVPVKQICERLMEMSSDLNDADRRRAIQVLEALLSNPGKSEPSQARLETAIATLRGR